MFEALALRGCRLIYERPLQAPADTATVYLKYKPHFINASKTPEVNTPRMPPPSNTNPVFMSISIKKLIKTMQRY